MANLVKAVNRLDLTWRMLLNGLGASAAMEGVPQRGRDEQRYRSRFGLAVPWYRRRFMKGSTLRFFR